MYDFMWRLLKKKELARIRLYVRYVIYNIGRMFSSYNKMIYRFNSFQQIEIQR